LDEFIANIVGATIGRPQSNHIYGLRVAEGGAPYNTN